MMCPYENYGLNKACYADKKLICCNPDSKSSYCDSKEKKNKCSDPFGTI